MDEAKSVIGERLLASRGEVMRPDPPPRDAPGATASAPDHPRGRSRSPRSSTRRSRRLLEARPDALVFGEDVGVKGGVYGVTRGLRKRFGGRRVFDTLLDEQTILGTALGAALAGLLPIPEIQYLAYLHNAEDQLRGEAASLAFFSDGQYRNPMVVRIAGLAYQKGFGGHFHNDNSLAVLRDIPGLVLCVPEPRADAPLLLRGASSSPSSRGAVCVVLEPIALYHERDLHEPGDGPGRLRTPPSPARRAVRAPTATAATCSIVTFGNGVPMSLRAAAPLEPDGVRARSSTCAGSPRCRSTSWRRTPSGFRRVLVVDETRRSGGVGEGIVSRPGRAGVRRAHRPGRERRLVRAARPGGPDGAGQRGRDRRGRPGDVRRRRWLSFRPVPRSSWSAAA